MNFDGQILTLVFTLLLYMLGGLSAISAIMSSRTSQGAIAWSISLLTFPLLTLPLYWVFGRQKFNGYVEAHREEDREISPLVKKILSNLPDAITDRKTLTTDHQLLERLAAMPFTNLNQLDLLIDGKETFDAIFEAIDRAEHYVLVQFYIYRDDQIGKQLHDKLIAAEARGVQVYVLFDEIGCTKLPMAYIRSLREQGAEVSGFKTRQGPHNRFQINFRNHRKIVVVDGMEAFVGGHNVGDEYLGRDPAFSPWRDTHVRIQGPAVLAAQLSFLNDWNWAVRRTPALNWLPIEAPEPNDQCLVMPSGPSDDLETWKLTMLHGINSAKERFWLVSPYFVPDSDVLSALRLAALRGVDVRIMLPENPDHKIVFYAGLTFLPELNVQNIQVYRFGPGFLHQKVFLRDDDMAVVSTANADNRSFRLNFEISVVGVSPEFVRNVEKMLVADFAVCRTEEPDAYLDRPILFRFMAQICRLFAPIL